MTDLFSPYTLNNGVTIKNRLVVAPMTHYSSNPDGTMSEAERHFLHNRAVDMGMFISAATAIADGGVVFIGQPMASSEMHLDSLKQTAKLLKDQGAIAILQLYHGGLRSVPKLNQADIISASDDAASGARAATLDEVDGLINAFARATDLAIRAGFDGVEIHAANGYLIQQFFSAITNQRDDHWGGSLDKRLNLPMAVIDAVAAVRTAHARPDFIIGYRFSPEEPGEHGITMTETFALIDRLITKPLQYLHISLWGFDKKVRRGADTSRTRIELIHERINAKLPLIGVGNLRTAETIRGALATGDAEFVAVAKASMLNPNLATLLKQHRDSEIITELDPERADRYGLPEHLWQLAIAGGAWLPPIKGQPWQPRDA